MKPTWLANVFTWVLILLIVGCGGAGSPSATREQSDETSVLSAARATAAAIVSGANATATALASNGDQEYQSWVEKPSNTPSPTSTPLSPRVPTPTEIPISGNAPEGFLAIQPDYIQFLQWTEDQSGGLSGQYQAITTKAESPFEIEPRRGRLSGTRNGSDISLTFEGRNTFTGTLDDGTLTLVAPSSTGELETIEYVRSSIKEYNRAARTFRQSVEDQAAQQAAAEEDQAAQQAAAEAEAKAAYDQAFSECLPYGQAIDEARSFVFNRDGAGPAGDCAERVIDGHSLLEAMKLTCEAYQGVDTGKGCDFGQGPVLYKRYAPNAEAPAAVSKERDGVLVTVNHVNLTLPSTSASVTVQNNTANELRVYCKQVEAVQGGKSTRAGDCSAWDAEDEHGTSPAVSVATIAPGRGVHLGLSFSQLDPTLPMVFKIPLSQGRSESRETVSLKWKISSTIEGPTITMYVDAARQGYEVLNLRSLPSVDATIKREMPNGAALHAEVLPVLDLEGREWYRVSYQGQTGFALGELLSSEAP